MAGRPQCLAQQGQLPQVIAVVLDHESERPSTEVSSIGIWVPLGASSSAAVIASSRA